MKRLSALLIVVGLVVGMIGCQPVPAVQYELTISSSEGGSVTTPGEGTFTYDEGRTVNLVAVPASGYSFGGWTGDVSTVANVNAASTKITMNGDYSITANFQAIPPARYSLTIYSSAGGSVTSPGEGTFTYEAGTVVDLVAEPDDGYGFTEWTGSVGVITDVSAASTTITMNGYCTITANFAKGIRNWYDLDGIRDSLSGHYVLMNDLGSATEGYLELAGPMANQGSGWEPIGYTYWDGMQYRYEETFVGILDGQGHEIRHLFINRPEGDRVGLFGEVRERGTIKNLSVADADLIGHSWVGGLVGLNHGILNDCYSGGSVTGHWSVGGLVGANHGKVSNSYSEVSVTGPNSVGGLVGFNADIVSNSHYDYDRTLINGQHIITIGALPTQDFQQWLANDKYLDVNQRLSLDGEYHLIGDADDLKQLLAFGQDSSLRFRLTDDLDLASEPDFYIPYLAGHFDGNGHRVWNASVDLGFVSQVGLFGYLACAGTVSGVAVENVDMNGDDYVGGLVGTNDGTVTDSCSTGSVAGKEYVGGLAASNWGAVANSYSAARVTGQGGVGGLLGGHHGTVGDSYATGSVTGDRSAGGLVGWNTGTVSNSHYDYDEVLVNGQSVITIGALRNKDFDQWLANDKLLDVNERLSQEGGYYLIYEVNDLKQLLAFGQDGSLKFRLKGDLDLATESNFYIPYLAAEFEGNGHRIQNANVSLGFVSHVGLFGYLAHGGKVSAVGADNVDMSGGQCVGGLVGGNWGGAVVNCYSSGTVSGRGYVGGLVGYNTGGVSNSYSVNRVTGGWDTGGLVGTKWGVVASSFWDTQMSGQPTSAGGIGKTTAEMKSIGTFSSAGWSIVGVAEPGSRNTDYTWNIVDGQTYPFLSGE